MDENQDGIVFNAKMTKRDCRLVLVPVTLIFIASIIAAVFIVIVADYKCEQHNCEVYINETSCFIGLDDARCPCNSDDKKHIDTINGITKKECFTIKGADTPCPHLDNFKCALRDGYFYYVMVIIILVVTLSLLFFAVIIIYACCPSCIKE